MKKEDSIIYSNKLCENDVHDYIISEVYTGGTKYRCTKCGKIKHTSTLYPDQKEEDNEINISNFLWGDRQVNKIKKIVLSWGLSPNYYIDYENDNIYISKGLSNNSRITKMLFPKGLFEDIEKTLDEKRKKSLIQFLETFDFTKWMTEKDLIYKLSVSNFDYFISQSFSCIFDDGSIFYCANPPKEQFNKLIEYFKSLFSIEELKKIDLMVNDEEYILLDPDQTATLYSNTLVLTNSKDEIIQFEKNVVFVGTNRKCDLVLNERMVASIHAMFIYENNRWFLRDNYSKNGTWLNGEKIQPGKKYQLTTNYEIQFAKTETFIFDKHEHSQENEEANIKLFETVLALHQNYFDDYYFYELNDITPVKEEYRSFDNNCLSLIYSLLLKTPLYFPVEMDFELIIDKTMLFSNKEHKLRIKSSKGTSIKAFTSYEVSDLNQPLAKFYPNDYIVQLIEMNCSVTIYTRNMKKFNLSPFEIRNEILPIMKDITISQSKSETKIISIDEVVFDKYLVKEVLGISLYTTYLVKDIHSHALFVMKVCDKMDKRYVLAMRENLLMEPYMTSKLYHLGSPKMIDVIENERYICIVREYIEGQSLEKIVKKYGPQPVEKVVDWSKQICELLSNLHCQEPKLIYRDVKPSNIILKPDGKIMFIDFGIMQESGVQAKREALGTIGYAAPEQCGNGCIDDRTDIYGLGMTMFRLVTGIDPTIPNFKLKRIRSINRKLPKGLEYIIQKCTRKDPEERYYSCSELRRDLDEYQKLSKFKVKIKRIFE